MSVDSISTRCKAKSARINIFEEFPVSFFGNFAFSYGNPWFIIIKINDFLTFLWKVLHRYVKIYEILDVFRSLRHFEDSVGVSDDPMDF
ncbi:hypothetical protein AR158_c095R [Paramecium bursaria Chlorella virus AR158]|uniref:hypothetical protein n=1 Tax=Paramecium bursaria Chlorella virus AR158 TaxID=380598 RepID=UPI00015AA7A9|nr:hypothetical protein AR158_c095R [Paramecium bursaria Chlorella virus AR158]ABU43641.1 hypothetical protein AR158_c095R [Paramecium bursaria Chlorella virus AR158]